jgi:hypothetical protein
MREPTVGRQAGARGAVVALAGCLGLCFWRQTTSFVGAPPQDAQLTSRDGRRDHSQVAMRSQGQGGRFNLWQRMMPKVKKTKKLAITRPRKAPGSWRGARLPKRYPLYDILEDIDENVPDYTIVEEPEEPMQPVYDVGIKKRYPWAGPLDRLTDEKIEKERTWDSGMEPLHGSIIHTMLPPLGLVQNFEMHKGTNLYRERARFPPWLNRPPRGLGVKANKFRKIQWTKDRRVRWENLTKYQKASGFFPKIEFAVGESLEDEDEDVDMIDDAELDELDDGLDAALER